jgi:hypothetical protein
LGFDWYIVSPYELSKFYGNGSTSFDREGVKVFSINNSSLIYNSEITVDDLLLSCVVTLPNTSTETISFGNQTAHKTPGVLIYYPIGTNIVFRYRKLGDNSVRTTSPLTLNTTYASANIPNYKDGPLQGINRTNTINRKLTKDVPLID